MHEQYNGDDNPEDYPTKERIHGWKWCDDCQHKVRERRKVNTWSRGWILLKCQCGNKWKVREERQDPDYGRFSPMLNGG